MPISWMKNGARLALLASLVLVASCAKDPSFKYKVPPDARSEYKQVHQVKSLVGGAADIVWVIDNSGSMSEEQTEVIRNAGIFMQKFEAEAKGMDWRMGMISTDQSEPPYIGFLPSDRLDPNTRNPVMEFQRAVGRLGLSGDGTERAFEPLRRTFTTYSDFLRPHAKLFLIIVSDELEQSNNFTARSFYDYLLTLKKAEDISTYGILSDTQGCNDNEYAGSKYEEFLTISNGLLYSICSNTYGTLLGEIGADIGRKLANPRIFLDSRPDLSTLKIFFHDQELRGGALADGGFWIYEYDTNSIMFHNLQFAQGDNENVRVEYRFLRD